MAEKYDQSLNAFDDSPGRFRSVQNEERFSGASGLLFEQAMAQTRMAICLTDPNQEDDPIVFCNRAVRELTGYDEDEIVGHNCRWTATLVSFSSRARRCRPSRGTSFHPQPRT